MLPGAIYAVRPLENVLAYLAHTSSVEYCKDQVIYDEQRRSSGLFLVVAGMVKVTTVTEDGKETVIGFFRGNELFGVSSILPEYTMSSERATALVNTVLMVWPRLEIEAQIERQPRLGLALMQMLSGLCLDLEERM